MSLIPYQRFSIDTASAPADATARLAAAVARRSVLGSEYTLLPFDGWVRGDQFKISLVVRHRYGSASVLRGRIVATAGGCRLQGRMRLNYGGSVFLALWSASLLSMVPGIVREAPMQWLPLVAVLALVIGLWTFILRTFASEARKARELFHGILEGRDPRLLLDESTQPTHWVAVPHGASGNKRPVSPLSTSVREGRPDRGQTVSSSFTPWWKFGFPLFFIVLTARSDYDFVAHPELLKGGRTFGHAFGVLLFSVVTVFLVRQHARYRRVKITKTGLLVSNYFREIHVPFTGIAGVAYDWSSGNKSPATVKVSFREATPLGREAEFFPRGRRDRAIAEGIVAEIGRRAGLAPRSAGAAAG